MRITSSSTPPLPPPLPPTPTPPSQPLPPLPPLQVPDSGGPEHGALRFGVWRQQLCRLGSADHHHLSGGGQHGVGPLHHPTGEQL